MKTIGVVIAGVFVGVVICELIRKSNPEILKGVEESATSFANNVKSAFKDGYEEAEAS